MATYEKIALLTILLDAAVTGENKPHIAYAESGPYLTVYQLGRRAKLLAEVLTQTFILLI